MTLLRQASVLLGLTLVGLLCLGAGRPAYRRADWPHWATVDGCDGGAGDAGAVLRHLLCFLGGGLTGLLVWLLIRVFGL